MTIGVNLIFSSPAKGRCHSECYDGEVLYIKHNKTSENSCLPNKNFRWFVCIMQNFSQNKVFLFFVTHMFSYAVLLTVKFNAGKVTFASLVASSSNT